MNSGATGFRKGERDDMKKDKEDEVLEEIFPDDKGKLDRVIKWLLPAPLKPYYSHVFVAGVFALIFAFLIWGAGFVAVAKVVVVCVGLMLAGGAIGLIGEKILRMFK